MLVAEELCALRMAEDSGEEAELPECNCDVTRQASPGLSCVLHSFMLHVGVGDWVEA